MTEYTNQPQQHHDSNTIAEALNIYELIDSTGGILLGKNARAYNQIITDLIKTLTDRQINGTILADPTGEATDKERLRIAIAGETYYRRRGTLWARQIAELLQRTAIDINDLLDAALQADTDNNLLGREGLIHDELEAENLIEETEAKIDKERRTFSGTEIRTLRPGETFKDARDDWQNRLRKLRS